MTTELLQGVVKKKNQTTLEEELQEKKTKKKATQGSYKGFKNFRGAERQPQVVKGKGSPIRTKLFLNF